jgi:hypothetical protein
METKKTIALICIFVFNLFFSYRKDTFNKSFEDFCTAQGFSNLLTETYKKEVDEKENFVELKKNCQLVQFSKYVSNDDQEIYLFSNFVTSNCGLVPTVQAGCYMLNSNNTWKEVTKAVMPDVSFMDFYGEDAKPPKGYENLGTVRYELRKNNSVTLVLEQNWANDDPKKERIFNQVKYSAIDLKWNKKDGVFTIKKWLR